MTADPTTPRTERTVTLNGAEHRTRATSLLELVAEHTGVPLGEDGRPSDGSALGIAVAADGAVVPRGRWGRVPVEDGAVLEVLTATKGG